MVHALLVERLIDDVRGEQQAALLVALSGGKPEWPDMSDRLAELEAALVAPPEPTVKAADADLRAALGLRVA